MVKKTTKTTITLTTIRVPKLLREYVINIQKFDVFDTEIIVVGDVRTPEKENRKLIKEICDKGVTAEYLGISEQKEWLKEYPKLSKIIPFNSDNRRNIGYLIAAEKGADTIISIDDDNFVSEDNFVGIHNIVGKTLEIETVRITNGWFNPCSMLQVNPPITIYPRGFPFSKRWNDSYVFTKSKGKIVMNMGLWLEDPDVDAITNLALSVKVTGFTGKHIALDIGTFAPINTQNTCFHRDVLPCYYYIPMDTKIQGMKLDRYGDIWSGFFAKKVIDSMGDRVSVGRPLTHHRRNPHDLLEDLKNELWGIILTEHLVQELERIELNQRTYLDNYVELAEKLRNIQICNLKSANKYFQRVTESMQIWADTCEQILT